MSRAGCGVFLLKRFCSATRFTKCQSAGKTEKHGIVKVIGISRSVVRCSSSCATRCGTGTSTICSQILAQFCSCGTILNSSTMSQLHNLLADPLQHSFPWDQLHHLNAFIQQLRLWHMLDGSLLHSFQSGHVPPRLSLLVLRHWRMLDSPLHSSLWDQLHQPRNDCHDFLHDRRHWDVHHLISDSVFDALHKHRMNHLHDAPPHLRHKGMHTLLGDLHDLLLQRKSKESHCLHRDTFVESLLRHKPHLQTPILSPQELHQQCNVQCPNDLKPASPVWPVSVGQCLYQSMLTTCINGPIRCPIS